MAGLLKKLAVPKLIVAALVLYATAFPAIAQDAPLNVLTETYPDNPQAGEPWTFTIMIDHPNTRDVIVEAPRFPESMHLERVRSGTWFAGNISPGFEDNNSGSRWTYIEYLFYLRSAGTIILEPFVISVGERSGTTSRLTLMVREMPGTVVRPLPYFRWEHTSSSFVSGIESEIILALYNWDPAKPQPRSLLQGRIPERFIMEEQPSVYDTTDTVIRYPIRIIPLDSTNFIFSPLNIQIEGESLLIPELFVPVLANPRPAQAMDNTSFSQDEHEALQEVPLQEASLIESHNIPFMESSQDVFPLFRKAYAEHAAQAQSLWENGSRAKALALVRSNERDSPFGPSFILLRRAMEEAIGLSGTENESWSFPFRLAFIIGGLFLLLVSCLVTFRSFKGLIYIILQLVTAGLGAVLIYAGVAGFFSNNETSHSAVLNQTEAFRVPDSAGAVSTQFKEGQAVRILSTASSWRFVESADGSSGWVEAEVLFVY